MNKWNFLFTGFLLISAPAFAAPTTSSTTAEEVVLDTGKPANILRGNFEAGGTAGLGYSSFQGVAITIQPTFKYFVMDHLAVGLVGAVDLSRGQSYFDLGPSVDYYFLQKDKWAYLVGQDFRRYISRSTLAGSDFEANDWNFQTRLGARYFVSPMVAIGADLFYNSAVVDEKLYGLNGGLQFKLGIFF
ncbi:MAG: hypothetical protein K2X47_04325 [Bdellovibrionales bacterium]|nr:hypothetical protein [Bdellovibrionales bacterium]